MRGLATQNEKEVKCGPALWLCAICSGGKHIRFAPENCWQRTGWFGNDDEKLTGRIESLPPECCISSAVFVLIKFKK